MKDRASLILEDEEIQATISAKAHVLAVSPPVGIGKYYQYVYSDKTTELLIQFDNMLLSRIKVLLAPKK